MIAQEAEQAILEERGNKPAQTSIVTHDQVTDRYGVRYSELISPLIKSVQELYNRLMGIEVRSVDQDREIAFISAKTQKLEADIAAKDNEIAELKARLDKIEKMLQAK